MIQYKETKHLSKANVHSLNVTHKYKNIISHTTFPLNEISWSVILRLSATNSSCWQYNYTAPYDSHDWPRGFHVHYIHHTLWLQTWDYGIFTANSMRPSQVRIQDLVKGGGAQLLRPKVADIAKRSHASEASILRPGSRARLRALEAFGFLMLKYAFSHILETLFLLFLTSILTPKVDKNRALDFTSINLRHSDMLHLFFNLHEKVML